MSNYTQYARGSKAWGNCARCGLRALLNDLVFDEYLPGMRVHSACKDFRHPQERLPKTTDPTALWKPSPDDADTAPVLTGVTVGIENELSWTAAVVLGPRVESYAVYRSSDSGVTFSLLTTLAVTYSTDFSDAIATLEYTDSTASAETTYQYYVEALDSYSRQLRSNTVSLTTGAVAETFLRLLESEDFRELEVDNDIRLLEDAGT